MKVIAHGSSEVVEDAFSVISRAAMFSIYCIGRRWTS